MKRNEHRSIYFSETTLKQTREYMQICKVTRSQAIRELIATGYGLWKRTLAADAPKDPIVEVNP